MLCHKNDVIASPAASSLCSRPAGGQCFCCMMPWPISGARMRARGVETYPHPGIRTRLSLTERVPSSNALTRQGAALVFIKSLQASPGITVTKPGLAIPGNPMPRRGVASPYQFLALKTVTIELLAWPGKIPSFHMLIHISAYSASAAILPPLRALTELLKIHASG